MARLFGWRGFGRHGRGQAAQERHYPICPLTAASQAIPSPCQSVLALIARLQEQKELKRCIQLVFGPDAIQWQNYFFDLTRYCNLHQYLLKKAREQPNKLMPIALAVELDPRAVVTPTTTGYFQLRARPSRCPGEDGDVFRVTPVLYFTERSLAESVAKQDVILACAIPRIAENPWIPPSGGLPIVSLSLNIYHAFQVCRYFSI